MAIATRLFSSASVIFQEPVPRSLEVKSRVAPLPEAGPDSFSSTAGSRSTSGFQSLKRRRLLTVSYTIVILRLVSMLSVM